MMLLYFSFTADAVRVTIDGDCSGVFGVPVRMLGVIPGERDFVEDGVLFGDFVLDFVGVTMPSSASLMCAYGS